MKTIIIFDQLDAELKFYVVNGDYSCLDGTYINQYIEDDGQSELDQYKLHSLLYNEDGILIKQPEKSFPTHLVNGENKVIVAGFLP